MMYTSNNIGRSKRKVKRFNYKGLPLRDVKFDVNQVRAHFILRGTTVTAWARGLGIKKQILSHVLSGRRKGLGPIGTRIVSALLKELGR